MPVLSLMFKVEVGELFMVYESKWSYTIRNRFFDEHSTLCLHFFCGTDDCCPFFDVCKTGTQRNNALASKNQSYSCIKFAKLALS